MSCSWRLQLPCESGETGNSSTVASGLCEAATHAGIVHRAALTLFLADSIGAGREELTFFQ
jgi:hypothetical protein